MIVRELTSVGMYIKRLHVHRNGQTEDLVNSGIGGGEAKRRAKTGENGGMGRRRKPLLAQMLWHIEIGLAG